MFLCKDLEVRNVGEKGRGVFATAQIPAGTLIADYLGVVLHPDETRWEDRIYEVWYSDLANISPDITKDDAYLINHSCEANCGIGDIERHMIICTLRTIFPGEEISFTYMIGPEPKDNTISRPCLCGTTHCRGTLFSDVAQFEAWENWMENIQKDIPEEPPVSYGEELPPLQTYPETLPDIEVYSVYGSRTQEPTELHASTLPCSDELRKIIRETGRQIEIPNLNMRVEGVLFNGQVIATESAE